MRTQTPTRGIRRWAFRKLGRNTYTRYVRGNSKVSGRLRRAQRVESALVVSRAVRPHEKVRLDQENVTDGPNYSWKFDPTLRRNSPLHHLSHSAEKPRRWKRFFFPPQEKAWISSSTMLWSAVVVKENKICASWLAISLILIIYKLKKKNFYELINNN